MMNMCHEYYYGNYSHNITILCYDRISFIKTGPMTIIMIHNQKIVS